MAYKINIKKFTQTSCWLFIWKLNAVIVVMDSCSDTFFALRFIIGGLWFTVNRHRAAVKEKNNFDFPLEKNTIKHIYTLNGPHAHTCFTYLKQRVKNKKKERNFLPKNHINSDIYCNLCANLHEHTYNDCQQVIATGIF